MKTAIALLVGAFILAASFEATYTDASGASCIAFGAGDPIATLTQAGWSQAQGLLSK